MKKTTSSRLVQTISAPNHLRLGEYHPAFGGALLGLFRGEPKQPNYYLFKAVGKDAETVAIFGNNGDRVKGADHDRDGLANTIALVESGITHPAAQWARNYTQDGFSDYYLMAREEARLARTNAPELFQRDAIYQTSTQGRGNDDFAWVQYFGSNGLQWGSYKNNERRVCPVRRVLIIQ